MKRMLIALIAGGVVGLTPCYLSSGELGGGRVASDGPYSYEAWSGLVDGPHLRFNNDTREWEMSKDEPNPPTRTTERQDSPDRRGPRGE